MPEPTTLSEPIDDVGEWQFIRYATARPAIEEAALVELTFGPGMAGSVRAVPASNPNSIALGWKFLLMVWKPPSHAN